jgi:hypothetical protein
MVISGDFKIYNIKYDFLDSNIKIPKYTLLSNHKLCNKALRKAYFKGLKL